MDAEEITATGYGGSAVTVWGSTGRGHGGTVCAQADGQTVPRGGGHAHTAEETAPGRATRLGWPGQVRGALRGRSDRAARGDVVLAQAALGRTGSRTRYTPVADVVLEVSNLEGCNVWCCI